MKPVATINPGNSIKSTSFTRKFLVTILFVLCPNAWCDEPPSTLSPQEWVKAYEKEGGNAKFVNENDGTLSITMYKKDKHVDFAKLPKPSSVKMVTFHGGSVQDTDIQQAMSWKGVESIELSDCSAVTDVGVKFISENLSVSDVVLGDTAVTSAGVNSFSGHSSLRTLSIVNSNSPVSAVKSIDLDSLPKCESLHFSCPQLVTLRIADCQALTRIGGLSRTLESVVLCELPKLVEFDASNSSLNKITVSGKSGLETVNVRKTLLTEL
jgi:hypothetical protein